MTMAQQNIEDFRQGVRDRFYKIIDGAVDIDPEDCQEWATEIERGIYDSVFKDEDFVGLPRDLWYTVTRKEQVKNVRPKTTGGNKKEKTVVRMPVKDIYRKNLWKVICALNVNPRKHELIERLCEEKVKPYDLGSLTHVALDPNCFAVQYSIDKEKGDSENQTRVWKEGKGRRGIAIKIPYDIVEEEDKVTGEIIKREVEVPNSMLVCGKCGMSKTTSYEMQTRSADEPMTIFASCLCCGNRWRF
jgi:DNA-directed RNA polymerase subunit M/transcription elongation factor TFIIS